MHLFIDAFVWKKEKLHYIFYTNFTFEVTVKPVLTTTFLKWPPVLNDHVVVLP